MHMVTAVAHSPVILSWNCYGTSITTVATHSHVRGLPRNCMKYCQYRH